MVYDIAQFSRWSPYVTGWHPGVEAAEDWQARASVRLRPGAVISLFLFARLLEVESELIMVGLTRQ